MTSGQLIKSARKKLGLKQIKLAKKLGLKTSQAISDWERDRENHRVPIEKILPLSKILKIDSKELLLICYPEIKEIVDA